MSHAEPTVQVLYESAHAASRRAAHEVARWAEREGLRARVDAADAPAGPSGDLLFLVEPSTERPEPRVSGLVRHPSKQNGRPAYELVGQVELTSGVPSLALLELLADLFEAMPSRQGEVSGVFRIVEA